MSVEQPPPGAGMQIETLETPELGDRSYVVHDGQRALVIDPQRDIDRILAFVDRAGLSVDLILETHIHNDYVSGGPALARATGARYGIAASEPVDVERVAVSPGDTLTVGRLTVSVEAAPGHTLHHLAYTVATDGHSQAVFSGGSLLFGTVGRTDLDHRSTPAALTRLQYRGVGGLLERLPATVSVHPTHGFGSFCSSSASSGAAASTIGSERRDNLVVRCSDEDDFVATILAGLTAYPRYYAQMGPINRAGAAAAELGLPRLLDAQELRHRIRAGSWVIDLAPRHRYADGHLAGTVSMELSTNFSTYAGWVIPPGAAITLIGSDEQLATARRDLARIGREDVTGVRREVAGSVMTTEAERAYPRTDFAGAAAEMNRATDAVLDVRRDDEWRRGHIDGAVHIALPDLLERLGEVPTRRLWVHCAGGFRASIATSLLHRSGFEVVLIDDDFDHAAEAGLLAEQPVASAEEARGVAGAPVDKENRHGHPHAEPAHAGGRG
ncbi:MAG: MBL fold metallo-hydrolase [Candidatus Dormibacteria bacterium]